MPLQYAILTHPRFPVRIMGLVHIANEIEQPALAGRRRIRLPELDRRTSRSGPRPRVRPLHVRERRQGHRLAGEIHVARAPRLDRQGGLAQRAPGAALRASRAKDRSRPRRISMRRARSADDTGGCPAISIRSILPTAARGCSDSSARSRTACGRWRERSRPSARVRLRRRCACTSSSSFRCSCPALRELEHWPHDDRRVFVLKSAESDRPHLAGFTRTS